MGRPLHEFKAARYPGRGRGVIMDDIYIPAVKLTKERVFVLLSLVFLTWRPAFVGSETLQLTTYYPAPYGGYVSILTTGQTILARDSSAVGIGGTPGATMSGNGQTIKLDLRSGGLDMAGGTTIHSRGRMHIDGEEILYLLNQNGVVVSKAWNGDGSLTVEGQSVLQGTVHSLCVRRSYWLGDQPRSCPNSHPQLIGHGGSQAWTGYWDYPLKSVVGNRNSGDGNGTYWTWDLNGNYVYYNYLGDDWNGWMTCCNMDVPYM